MQRHVPSTWSPSSARPDHVSRHCGTLTEYCRHIADRWGTCNHQDGAPEKGTPKSSETSATVSCREPGTANRSAPLCRQPDEQQMIPARKHTCGDTLLLPTADPPDHLIANHGISAHLQQAMHSLSKQLGHAADDKQRSFLVLHELMTLDDHNKPSLDGCNVIAAISLGWNGQSQTQWSITQQAKMVHLEVKACNRVCLTPSTLMPSSGEPCKSATRGCGRGGVP